MPAIRADRESSAPVDGGELAYGEWNPAAPGPAVLAVHGITATHRAWPVLARHLPGTRILAPDLRGRGRSADLPAPYGLRQHARDLAALLDHAGLDRVVVVGHSMGAFVSVRFAAAHPDRVASLVLVDGGVPLAVPEGVSPEDLPRVTLGPALERLSQAFPSREAYRDFWRAHPALGPYWSEAVAGYVDYDLVESDGALRPSPNPEAVAQSARELGGQDGYPDDLAALRMRVDVLRAPRGLLDADPLYAPGVLDAAVAALPDAALHEVEDVNHYTIVMSDRGAEEVAAVVRTQLAAA